ncbi:10289_t:CDS:1, partial [Cetraspora pellucida]
MSFKGLTFLGVVGVPDTMSSGKNQKQTKEDYLVTQILLQLTIGDLLK